MPSTPRRPRSTKQPSQVGDWAARCRTARQWSRSDFVAHAHRVLPHDHPLYYKINENWIRNIEEGGRKYLDHLCIATLCLIYGATQAEKTDLLIAAKLNPLADDNGNPSEVQQTYLRQVAHLFNTKVAMIVERGLATGRITSQSDLMLILRSAIEIEQMTDSPTTSTAILASPSVLVHRDSQK